MRKKEEITKEMQDSWRDSHDDEDIQITIERLNGTIEILVEVIIDIRDNMVK